MSGPHGIAVSTVTLGAPDPLRLTTFYARLLGWPEPVLDDGDDGTWVSVRPPGGGVGIAAQLEPTHRAPVWPQSADDQQMQLHLEVKVDDLDGAVRHALECGATLAEFQPQDDVRVCLDPAGHPFCLWVPD